MKVVSGAETVALREKLTELETIASAAQNAISES